jgi:hypothetical protein
LFVGAVWAANFFYRWDAHEIYERGPIAFGAIRIDGTEAQRAECGSAEAFRWIEER